MKKHIKLLVSCITIFLTSHAFANEQSVKNTMTQYWTLYSSGQLLEASKMIHPDDLKDMQTYILPVFVKASKSDDSEISEFANHFFKNTGDQNFSLSPNEVFVNFNSLITAFNPQVFELIKGSSITVSQVEFKTPTHAIVTYAAVSSDGITQIEDSETFIQIDDSWFLRMKEAPSVTANMFSQFFNKE